GLRAVTLGHAHPGVLTEVTQAMTRGMSFSRPSAIELQAAETLLAQIPGAEMVKFAKNGSDATTAAVRLARAATGRTRIAICGNQPFFSVDDWFIATTEMDAGTVDGRTPATLTFTYNDLDSVRRLIERYPGQIACLLLEPASA